MARVLDARNPWPEEDVPHHWIREVLQDMAHYAALHGLHHEHWELSRLVRVFAHDKQSVIPATTQANLINLASYRVPGSLR